MSGAAEIITPVIAGREQEKQFIFEAREKQTQARLEGLRAKERVRSINEQLESDIASANALFAARGITTGSGTSRGVLSKISQQASRDIEATQFGGLANQIQLRRQALNLRRTGKAAKAAGILQGISEAGKQAASIFTGGAGG